MFVRSLTQNQPLEYLENRLTIRIIKFYTDIQANLVYSHNGYVIDFIIV